MTANHGTADQASDYLELYGTVGDDHIIAPASDGFISIDAYTGSDVIEVDGGNTGQVWILLDDGGDRIYGGPGEDHLVLANETRIEDIEFHGGAGDDSVSFWGSRPGIGAGNVLDGGEGSDRVNGAGRGIFADLESGTALVGLEDESGIFYEITMLNFEHIWGSAGHDILAGTEGGNWLQGAPGDDLLSGRGGRDTLEGGTGDDVLVGGRDADRLESNEGADVIRIDRLVDSLPGQEDKILDFTFRDTIDLSRIDADLTDPGNQAFTFIGTAAFSGAAGELRYEVQGNDLLVSADADGDRIADLAVKVLDLTQLAAADFIL